MEKTPTSPNEIDMAHADNTQNGAALIIVLWTALLLSAALAVALASTRTEARITAARKEAFLAEQSARDGLEYAAQWISTEQAGRLDQLTSLEFSLNGYDVSFKPSSESDKLDLNLASEQTFSAIFELLGEDKSFADTLAARIADWRDVDNNPRPNGAERRDYATARNGEEIGNHPFYSADEINLVLGMPPELAECIAPLLTIFGDSSPPANTLLQSLYEKDLGGNTTTATTRLGTASRSAAAGARISITATAAKPEDSRRKPKSITGVFRVTGARQKPYEWIAQFEVSDVTLADNTCKNANNNR